MDSLPTAALGHFVMKVANLGASYQFYADLGLRQSGLFPDVAIIELRGGTHILLLPANDEAPFTLTSSRVGRRGAFFNEHIDLMINGKTRGELEAYKRRRGSDMIQSAATRFQARVASMFALRTLKRRVSDGRSPSRSGCAGGLSPGAARGRGDSTAVSTPTSRIRRRPPETCAAWEGSPSSCIAEASRSSPLWGSL
jgi:catechol 2,3-dioxygenase-like lactoylglutathione lyase family enzyme